MIGPTVMDATVPPKITPISGVLGKGKVAIRPIACRPVVSSASSTPILGARHFGTVDNSVDSEKPTSRSSWGQFSSTTDLRTQQQQQHQQPPSLPSKLDFRPAAQRSSWTTTPAIEVPESPQQRGKMAYPPGIPPNNTLTLARKFGGSLCNVATWQQPQPQQLHSLMSHADKPSFQSSTTSLVSNKPLEPPAYRPAPPLKPKPPRQMAHSNDNLKNYASIAKLGGSELHLDRFARSYGADGPMSLSSASEMCFNRLNVKCANGLSNSEAQLHCAAEKENGYPKSSHCSTLPRGSKGYSNATYTTFSFPCGRTCESAAPTDDEVIYSEPFGIDKPLLSPASFSDLVLDTPLSMESDSWVDLNDSMVSGRDSDTPVVHDGRIRSAQGIHTGSFLSLNGPSSLDFDHRSEVVTPVVHQGRIQLPSALESAKTRFRPLSENRSDGSLGSVGDFPDNSDSRSEFDPEGTPSPSDSGVAELEALIREKDSEISFLRETMEQNEAVIFKVYEEKEKSWERELRKLRLLYENRLKGTQNRVLRAEHNFSLHAQQWQNERRRMTQETEDIKRELTELKSHLEETSWSLCEKSGEVSLLKTQLRDSQNEQSARNQEIVRLKSQIRELQESLQHSQSECQSLQQLVTNNNNNNNNSTNSQEEVSFLKRQLAEQSHKFETEKQIWLEEKMTVLKYQKHLQQSYIKLHHRNLTLEHELGQLGITGVPLLSSSSSCSDPVARDVDLNSSCMSDQSGRSTTESQC